MKQNVLDKSLQLKDILGKKILRYAEKTYGIDSDDIVPHKSFSALNSSRSTDYRKEYIN